MLMRGVSLRHSRLTIIPDKQIQRLTTSKQSKTKKIKAKMHKTKKKEEHTANSIVTHQ